MLGLVSRTVLGSERLGCVAFVTNVVGSFSAVWILWEQDKISSLFTLCHLTWVMRFSSYFLSLRVELSMFPLCVSCGNALERGCTFLGLSTGFFCEMSSLYIQEF